MSQDYLQEEAKAREFVSRERAWEREPFAHGRVGAVPSIPRVSPLLL